MNYDLSFLDYEALDNIIIKKSFQIPIRKSLLKDYQYKVSEGVKAIAKMELLISKTAISESIYPHLINVKNAENQKILFNKVFVIMEDICDKLFAKNKSYLQAITEFIPTQKIRIKELEKEISINGTKENIFLLEQRKKALHSGIEELKFLNDILYSSTKWQLPTFQDLKKHAYALDKQYSETVEDFKKLEGTRYLAPPFLISLAKKLYFSENSDIKLIFNSNDKIYNPEFQKYITKAEIFITNELMTDDVTLLQEAINNYWLDLTKSIVAIENKYPVRLIKSLIDNKYRAIDDTRMIVLDENMQGFFSTIKKMAKSAFKVSLKISKPFVYFSSKITNKYVLTQIDKLLPKAYRGKLSLLTEVQIAMVDQKLSKKHIRKVVEIVKDVALIPLRANDELVRIALRVGPIRKLDKYSGGLLTSAKNINKLPIKLRDNDTINWRATAFDALKVGLAVASGGTAVYIATTTTAAVDQTGLSKSTAGVLIGASVAVASGGGVASVAKRIAVTTGSRIATDQATRKTSLGKSSLGRGFIAVGVGATADSISNNANYSKTLRSNARAKLKQVAKKRADQIVLEVSKGKVSLSTLEKVYSYKDKNIGDAYDDITLKLKERANKGYLTEKLKEEADREMKRTIDKGKKLTTKYGEDLLKHLMMKYGPQYDYDRFLTADDFLEYQVYKISTTNTRRIFNIDYIDKKGKIISYMVVAGMALGTVAVLV